MKRWLPDMNMKLDDFDKFDRIKFGRALARRQAGSTKDGANQYSPFIQAGGLGKLYQLFGDELNTIIEEMNEALAA